ncbi:MAG: SpoIIE family protein phosphatase [Chloroflexi bacterium]|nr:SpoIIE family protein phosphatase [Chloroflexota bacterium]
MKEPLVSVFHRVPFLSRLSSEELERLATAAEESRWPAGAVIFREGQSGQAFYIVKRGQVEIVKTVDGDEEVLGVHGPGGFFGEMALLEDLPRSAMARTLEPTELVELSRNVFRAHLQENPHSLLEITRELSGRLRETDGLIIRRLQDKNRQLRVAYRELQEAQAELMRRERIKRDLEVARGIVEDLLPKDFPAIPGWQFAARYRPAREVGGDLYNVIPLKEGRLGLFIGDVSDKSIPAALYMAVVRGLLQAEAQRSLSPRWVLNRIHHLLEVAAESSMFITAVYGVLNLANGEFRYVRAGHEPALLYKRRERASMILEGKGTPLGLLPEAILQERRVIISEGDFLVLYTDGVNETTNPQEEFFGRDRLRRVIEQRAQLSPEALCEALLREIEAFQGKAEQHDDIAILVVKAAP